MSIESTLEYIHSVKWRGAKPGLERTRELLDKLGNPEARLKFIHIAGTNGKGSTAAMLASVLRKSGYRTGLYTSPYNLRFNERMQTDGEQISDAELEELTEIIRPHADAMTDVPTEFEIVTALGMLYFERQKCDIVVLEVGMGGELDSTNVISTPELAVITAIGLDHTAELGGTVAQVASAKAGIIKPNGHVVVYGAEPDALDVFRRKCESVGSTLETVDFTRLNVRSSSLDGSVIDFAEHENITLPLAGSYQPRNAALAITAMDALRRKGYAITDATIRDGIAATSWAGRFEILRRDPTVILDGAHNAHGIAAACESFRTLFGDTKLVFMVGVFADKDVAGMMAQLAPFARHFVAIAPPDNPRALSAEKLAEILGGYGVPAIACATIPDGAREALRLAGPDGAIAALGSLSISADIRAAFDALK